MWKILVITQDYDWMVSEVGEALRLSHNGFFIKKRKDSVEYIIGHVFIKIYSCAGKEGIGRFRGEKADAIYTEEAWIRDLETICILTSMCPRGMIKNTAIFDCILYSLTDDAYDYRTAMKADIKKYIKEYPATFRITSLEDYYKMLDMFYDEIYHADEVTGNGELFYASETKCAEYVMSNLSLFFAADGKVPETDKFDDDDWLHYGAQHMDRIIRCYLLRDVLEEVFEEIYNDSKRTD